MPRIELACLDMEGTTHSDDDVMGRAFTVAAAGIVLESSALRHSNGDLHETTGISNQLVARLEGPDQSFRESRARALEAIDHLIHDRLAREPVSHRDVAATRAPACPPLPVVLIGARESGHLAVPVDAGELPVGPYVR